ncbi:MAG: BatD family protein [Pirellulales bacterium]|nr:BatD family protein [Pirellulales bacterium]
MKHLARRTICQIATVALAIAALECIAAGAKAADVQLSLSSRETYVGMPLTALVTINNAQSSQPPQFPAIDGVDIEAAGSPSRSSQTTIINGRMSHNESVTYAFELTPRREQKYIVPAMNVEVDGKTFTTEPTSFVAHKSETGDLMFVEVAGQKKEVFVGEPIKLTLKIWIRPYRDSRYDVTLSAGDTWSLVMEDRTDWGAFQPAIEELAKQRRQPIGREVLHLDDQGLDRSYYLYKIDHIVYPQHAGQLDPGDIQIVAAYPTGLERGRDFFSLSPRYSLSGMRPLAASAKVEPIDVKPVPTQGMPADYRGAIGRYEISTQAMPTKTKVGDPITLRLEIAGGERLDLLQAPPLASLSALTRDFKVAEEPLAGVVHGASKSFVATLRPLRTDVKQIPPIPFSSFDPETKEFVTVHSAPISIEVGPADELALSKIISAGGSNGASISAGEPTAEANPLTWQFRGPSLLESWHPPSDAALLTALAAPPLAFLGWLLMRQSRGWLQDSSMWRRWQARRLAARRLDRADSSEDVVRAAFGYVADRFGLNAASLTRHELVSQLQDRGVSPIAVEQWDDLLTECENAKYSGGATSVPQELARRARSCIAGFDRRSLSHGDTSCSA